MFTELIVLTVAIFNGVQNRFIKLATIVFGLRRFLLYFEHSKYSTTYLVSLKYLDSFYIIRGK